MESIKEISQQIRMEYEMIMAERRRRTVRRPATEQPLPAPKRPRISFPTRTSSLGRIQWRTPQTMALDDGNSLCDWTIEILHEESLSSSNQKMMDVYHVHRAILGFGPRGSEYFSKTFQQRDMKEQVTQSTRVIFPRDCAQLFPRLLDFVYHIPPPPSSAIKEGQDGPLGDISLDDAFHLYTLADYFQIPELMNASEQALVKAITMRDIPKVLEKIQQFGDPEPLLRYCIQYCLENLELLEQDIAKHLPPEFMVQVLKAYGLNQNQEWIYKGLGRQLGRFVLVSLEHHQHELSTELFQDVADCFMGMLLLDGPLALQLLLLESSLLASQQKQPVQGGTSSSSNESNENASVMTSPSQLTRLQQHCMELLSQPNRVLAQKKLFASRSDFVASMSKLPKHVLTHLLAEGIW